MKKIIAIVLVLVGIVGGGAAGMMLKPAPPEPEGTEAGAGDVGEKTAEKEEDVEDGEAEQSTSVYVKVGRQTIIPVLDKGETKALMLFELAVDIPPSENDRALAMEPRLRDAFLRELFQMSYTGAFDETFTDDRVIEELRRSLVRGG